MYIYKYIYLLEIHLTCDSVAEWSKALDLGSSLHWYVCMYIYIYIYIYILEIHLTCDSVASGLRHWIQAPVFIGMIYIYIYILFIYLLKILPTLHLTLWPSGQRLESSLAQVQTSLQIDRKI
jgi:hypothetical protein